MSGGGLWVERDDRGVVTLTMDRPGVRNAFDDGLVAALTAAAGDLAEDPGARVVVLMGAGGTFSAGADLAWMRAMTAWSQDENLADARRLDDLLRALWDLPLPLVGRVEGHALGGGCGLVAACDVVVAADDARFGFPEVGLGLAPAVISPYVVRTVGSSFARAAFVTGERFGATRAYEVGLVHRVVPAAEVDAAVTAVVERCLAAGPRAVAAAKALVEDALRPLDEATAATPEVIAALRVGAEGQEGMRAFLDRRPPAWRPAGP